MESPNERKAFSHRAVYIGFGLTLLLGFAAGLYIFFGFTTYEPRALRRVPESALFVARLNVQQAVVHQPLVASVLPVLEQQREGPESRLLHLERRTTLELDVDVRELVFAELESGAWLLVLDGFLRSDEVLDGVGRMLDDEGVEYTLNEGMIVLGTGASLCVAEDGSLVLSKDAADARRSCAAAGPAPSWAGELSKPGVALGVRARAADRSPGGRDARSHLKGGTFVIEADSHFPLSAEFGLLGDDWTGDQVDRLLQSKSNDFGYLVPLGTLKFRSRVGDRFRAQGNLSREQFDDTVARLASRIREAVWGDGGSRKTGP